MQERLVYNKKVDTLRINPQTGPFKQGRNMSKKHLILTKPGIILGNLITTGAGFALASKGDPDYRLLLLTLLGLSLIIAAACVCNNYIDRAADQKMERTKNRPLVTGTISTPNALCFAALLLLSGSFILFHYTNLLALYIALFGFFVYVVIYSFYKYHSSHATAIGSIAGATPPLVGYAALAGTIDPPALLLYSILVLWQMPHFYAIAVYRLKEYAAASIPVLPLEKGMATTKIQMLIYTIAFCIVAALPAYYGYAGTIYFCVTALVSLFWLYTSLKGFTAKNETLWARKMFFVSLFVITALCITLSFDQFRAL